MRNNTGATGFKDGGQTDTIVFEPMQGYALSKRARKLGGMMSGSCKLRFYTAERGFAGKPFEKSYMHGMSSMSYIVSEAVTASGGCTSLALLLHDGDESQAEADAVDLAAALYGARFIVLAIDSRCLQPGDYPFPVAAEVSCGRFSVLGSTGAYDDGCFSFEELDEAQLERLCGSIRKRATYNPPYTMFERGTAPLDEAQDAYRVFCGDPSADISAFYAGIQSRTGWNGLFRASSGDEAIARGISSAIHDAESFARRSIDLALIWAAVLGVDGDEWQILPRGWDYADGSDFSDRVSVFDEIPISHSAKGSLSAHAHELANAAEESGIGEMLEAYANGVPMDDLIGLI